MTGEEFSRWLGTDEDGINAPIEDEARYGAEKAICSSSDLAHEYIVRYMTSFLTLRTALRHGGFSVPLPEGRLRPWHPRDSPKGLPDPLDA